MTAQQVGAIALVVIALSTFASFVLHLADTLGRAAERIEHGAAREEALALQRRTVDSLTRSALATHLGTEQLEH